MYVVSEIHNYSSACAFPEMSDALKVSELDGLGCMDDVLGSVGNLLTAPLKDVKCVESIAFSSFNPPPSYRR